MARCGRAGCGGWGSSRHRMPPAGHPGARRLVGARRDIRRLASAPASRGRGAAHARPVGSGAISGRRMRPAGAAGRVAARRRRPRRGTRAARRPSSGARRATTLASPRPPSPNWKRDCGPNPSTRRRPTTCRHCDCRPANWPRPSGPGGCCGCATAWCCCPPHRRWRCASWPGWSSHSPRAERGRRSAPRGGWRFRCWSISTPAAGPGAWTPGIARWCDEFRCGPGG